MFTEAFNEAQSDQIASPEHEGDVLLEGIVAVWMDEKKKKKRIQHGEN